MTETTDTTYDKELFIADLAIFATDWVNEKMVMVMERADALWENEFARAIVKNYARCEREAKINRMNMAIAIANADRLSFDSESLLYKTNNERRSAYKSVLYDVLVNNKQ